MSMLEKEPPLTGYPPPENPTLLNVSTVEVDGWYWILDWSGHILTSGWNIMYVEVNKEYDPENEEDDRVFIGEKDFPGFSLTPDSKTDMGLIFIGPLMEPVISIDRSPPPLVPLVSHTSLISPPDKTFSEEKSIGDKSGQVCDVKIQK